MPSVVPTFAFYSNKIFGLFNFQVEGSMFINHILKVNGYRQLLIFGDTDGACSLTGTKRWIRTNGWKPTTAWTPWTINGQLFGFQQSFDNFTLATIHGRGHSAIYEEPAQASQLILNFILTS